MSLASVCAHGAIDPTRMVQVMELKLTVDWLAQPDLGRQGHEQSVDIFFSSYFDCGLCVWYLKLRGSHGIDSFAFIFDMILQQGWLAANTGAFQFFGCIDQQRVHTLRLISLAGYES